MLVIMLSMSLITAMLFKSGYEAHSPASTPASVIRVINSDTLQHALDHAQPGDSIQLADGVYRGTFTASMSGTMAAPITLQGTRRAVLDGGSVKRGYAFHLQADYWVLRGFTVTYAQKGIMADGANHNLLDGLRVFEIGHEAIHFRALSTHNTVMNCVISDTGVDKAGFGEGVYLGSAKSNWGKHSSGQPDTSDANRILNNHFGPNVRAEAIDIKEGTSGGEVRGNVFDGTGMSGANFADSWVDVKGNNYNLSNNRGSFALRDGFQTHRSVEGWGRNNRFRNNVADVQSSGYAIWIHLDGKDAAGNIVYSDNRATYAAAGIANVPLTQVNSPAPRRTVFNNLRCE